MRNIILISIMLRHSIQNIFISFCKMELTSWAPLIQTHCPTSWPISRKLKETVSLLVDAYAPSQYLMHSSFEVKRPISIIGNIQRKNSIVGLLVEHHNIVFEPFTPMLFNRSLDGHEDSSYVWVKWLYFFTSNSWPSAWLLACLWYQPFLLNLTFLSHPIILSVFTMNEITQN